MTRFMIVGAFLLACGCAAALDEDVPPEGRQVQSIVRNTASPFCPGKTLDSCPSPKAGQWRREIRDWVSEGVSEPEIRERLQARVPGFDLSIPPVKLGWIIPVVALALSTWWLVAMVRRLRRGAGSARADEPFPHDQTLDARLDQELARLD